MSKLLHPKEEEGNFYSADVGWQYTPTKARYSHRSSKVASSDESALKLNQGLIMEMMVTLLTTAVICSMQLSSFLFHM